MSLALLAFALAVQLASAASGCGPPAYSGHRRARVFARRSAHPGWARGATPHAGEEFGFSIVLKERNLVELEAHATAVSDPASKRYGQYWSAERIKALVAPPRKSVIEVTDWLSSHGAQFKVDGAVVSVRTRVAVAECLFGTEMAAFVHDGTGARRVRHLGAVSMPTAVARAVHLVWGVNELFKPVDGPSVTPNLDHESQTETRHNKEMRRTPAAPIQRRRSTMYGGEGAPVRNAISTDLMTPTKVGSMYGASGGDSVNITKQQSQAFVNFNFQVLTPGAMEKWNQKYGGRAHVDKTYYNGSVYDGAAPPGGYGPEGWYGLSYGEPDLDNDVISYFGAGAMTWSWDSSDLDGHTWMLNFANEVLAMDEATRPSVFSISWGGSELFQCEMLAQNRGKQPLCMQGYNTPNTQRSKPYVSATEAGFQKLALAGITIIVASGDDGAPSLAGGNGFPGNYPLDPARNCASRFHWWWPDADSPVQGPYTHNYTKNISSLNNQDNYCPGYPPEDKKPSKCSSFVLKMGCGYTCDFIMPTNTMFPFTTNGLRIMKTHFKHIDYRGFTNEMLNVLKIANPQCNLQWSYYTTLADKALQIYSECECSAMNPGKMTPNTNNSWWVQSNQICQAQACMAIPSNSPGHSISPYNENQRPTALDTYGGYGENSPQTDLMPVYPAASKWVTTVGGSALAADEVTHIVSSIWQGTWTTSGGGFAEYLTRPSWQNASVEAWLKKSTTAAELNWPDTRIKSKAENNRGYPDVAFQSFGYPGFSGLSNCTSVSSCDLKSVYTTPSVSAGTSASAPLFAGMVTSLNAFLAAKSKPRLGFLSPMLYDMAAKRPTAFSDITIGDNKCNKLYCSKYGYSAVPGWDPASGLGTIHYHEFKRHVAGLDKGFVGSVLLDGYSIMNFTAAVQQEYTKAMVASLPASVQPNGAFCCANAFITNVDHIHRRTHHTLMPITVHYAIKFDSTNDTVVAQAQVALNDAIRDGSLITRFNNYLIAAGIKPTPSPTASPTASPTTSPSGSDSAVITVAVVIVVAVLVFGIAAVGGVMIFKARREAEARITIYHDNEDISDFSFPPEYEDPSTDKVIQL